MLLPISRSVFCYCSFCICPALLQRIAPPLSCSPSEANLSTTSTTLMSHINPPSPRLSSTHSAVSTASKYKVSAQSDAVVGLTVANLSLNRAVSEQDVEPNDGSVLIYMNFTTTNIPCWFTLTPGGSASDGVKGEPWSLLARRAEQTTWSATATTTSASSTSTASSHPSNTNAQTTGGTQGRFNEPNGEMSGGAKAGIGIGVALSIIALGFASFLVWDQRRRKKQAVAKDMINFVDGDIVNLVDGGRFEGRKPKPGELYSMYPGSYTNGQPVYQGEYYAQGENGQGSTYSQPSVDGQGAYAGQGDYAGQGYYATQGDYTPGRQEYAQVTNTIPTMPGGASGPGIGDNASWANDGRHPYSPPGYDTDSPASDWSLQPEHDFYAVSRDHSSTTELYGPATPPAQRSSPVEALPAILPDNKPTAELPARDGVHGYGHESELPAPPQEPQRRQGPPMGQEAAEQKFLLSEMLPFMKKAKDRNPGPAG